MRKHDKKSRLGAMFLALAMVITMCLPGMAMAEEENETAKAEIKATGISDGADVMAYRIVEPEKEEGPFTGYKLAEGVTIADILNPTADEITTLAKGNNLDSCEKIPMTGDMTNGYTANAGPGLYLIKVTPATGDNKIYNPAIVAVNVTDANIPTVEGKTISFDSSFTNEAYVKSSEIGLTKTITDSNKIKDKVIAQEKGKTIDFEIAGEIPSYSDQYENVVYTIHDTLGDGFEKFEEDFFNDVVVTVGGEEVKYDEKTFSITKDGKHMTIAFVDSFIRHHGQQPVKVTYKAKLDGSNVNFNASTNKAHLEYSNEPGNTTNTEDKTTNQHTVEIKLTKTDEGDTPLQGAEFGIYYDKECTKPFATGTSDGNGLITFTGLGAKEQGTYYIKETAAPKGYSLNDHVFKLNITAEADDNGNLTKISTVLTDTEDTDNKQEAEITNDSENKVLNVGSIKDTKTQDLPSTGGMGTYVFTILGVAVIAIAGGLYMKKKNN